MAVIHISRSLFSLAIIARKAGRRAAKKRPRASAQSPFPFSSGVLPKGGPPVSRFPPISSHAAASLSNFQRVGL